MYVTDTGQQQQSPMSAKPKPPPAFPTYDVKIIAGRRVVIFHDKKPVVQTEQNQPTEEHQNPDIEWVKKSYKLKILNRFL